LTFKFIGKKILSYYDINPCHDIEIIKQEKIMEVWKIMHIQADELMRKELTRMIRSLEGKNKKKKEKKKKDKKSKKDKKKNKKDKDPFLNRSIESLWEELVQQRIVIQFRFNIFKLK
jgi:hypothetical protein